MSSNPVFQMGDEVEDQVSGYKGIIVARTESLNGCWRYVVQSRVDKDGKMPDAYSIDEMQLTLLNAGKVKATLDKSHGGLPTKAERF